MANAAAARFSARRRQRTTDQPSSDSISSGTAPSVPSATQSSPPGTPFSTGYSPASDSSIVYSPPLSTAMLPGAPQSVDLLLLTSYLTSTFKAAGKNNQRPTDAEKFAMQDLLLTSTYSRAEFSAAFLHAVDIACKALRAFAAAKAEVAASPQAAAVGEVEMDAEYMGMRTDFTCSSVKWKSVIVEVAQAMSVGQLHLAVVQAYCTVAECRIRIREVFQRQEDVRAAMETEANARMNVDVGMETEEAEGEVGDDFSRVKGECGGSQEGKEDDRMEVDSAYAAWALD